MTSHYYCHACQRTSLRQRQGISAGWAIFILLLGAMTMGLGWLAFFGAALPQSPKCITCNYPLEWRPEAA